jgi:hypothetical protein
MNDKLKPVLTYVYQRRGRFSALSTLAVLYPLMKRPQTKWTEWEKDFRMYDQMSKTKKK